MRRLAAPFVVCALTLPLAACSGSESVVMPDVVGKRLDVAISDVERAGFDDDVEVLGGGTFGVVDESNWTVCSQEPANGTEVSSAPRITVDRSCDAGDTLEPALADNKEPDADDSAEETTGDQPAVTSKKRVKKKRKQANAVAESFVMPPLVGMNLQKAQNLLQARGSFLLTQTDGTGQERFQMVDYGWKVCAQVPAAGTVTDLATLVELITVKLSEAC